MPNAIASQVVSFAFGGLFGAGIPFLTNGKLEIGGALVGAAILLGVVFACIGITTQRRSEREEAERKSKNEREKSLLQLTSYSGAVIATFSSAVSEQIAKGNISPDTVDELTQRLNEELEFQLSRKQIALEIYQELKETLEKLTKSWQMIAIRTEAELDPV